MRFLIKNSILVVMLITVFNVSAEKYKIDTSGTHAFIQFKISHLGYSWLYGRFNKFLGEFEYDESQPESASVNVTINTRSLDSNHALRDKHLRGKKYLNVKKFPVARFSSTSYHVTGDGTGLLMGDFSFRGVTKPIVIEVTQVGAGPDPWGGYRRGFEGGTTLKLADYGIETKALGRSSETLELTLSIEGIRQRDNSGAK